MNAVVDADRRTISIGDSLGYFLKSGSARAKSVSGRIDRLAARYQVLVKDLIPMRWSVADWLLVVQVTGEFELAVASDAPVLAVRLRQLAKTRGSSNEIGSLAYRVENLKLGEQLAAIDLAERAIAAGATSSEKLSEWLHQAAVTLA